MRLWASENWQIGSLMIVEIIDIAFGLPGLRLITGNFCALSVHLFIHTAPNSSPSFFKSIQQEG